MGLQIDETKGRQFYKLQEQNFYHLSNAEPTHCPTHPNKALYMLHFFINKGISFSFISALQATIDHTPLVQPLSNYYHNHHCITKT